MTEGESYCEFYVLVTSRTNAVQIHRLYRILVDVICFDKTISYMKLIFTMALKKSF